MGIERSPEPSEKLKDLVSRGERGFNSGQGFQSWSPEQIEDTHKRLKTCLLQVTSKSQKRGA